ncbi:oxidoreductase, FAD-binding [Euzebya pacifica]|uniref:Oxidoreductase, FAD-binding n=1 Tax=Euzebya pacifica TaxID=1608957 RepID=A0A346XVP2_9ACTN|nr:D-arabinono-1,4-lactone oxidase [Euzebya pacifica]AXV06289.1 oxidoreductase, FAD-binding [Euzebya pacifica]
MPRPTAARWSSWSGAVKANPTHLVRPESVAELAALVTAVGERGGTLRPTGTGHSFTPLASSEDTMVQLDLLDHDRVDITPDGRSATVSGGTTLRVLARRLAAAGLAVPRFGDIDGQTVAGALSTGTHDTGSGLGPLHTAVEGVELVDGTGTVRWVDHADLPAARLGLGALGVIVRVRMAVTPAVVLATRTAKVRLDDVLADFPHHTADHDLAEFSWLPHTGWARLRLGDITDEPPTASMTVRRAADLLADRGSTWVAGQVARTFPERSSVLGGFLAATTGDVASRRPGHEAARALPPLRFQSTAFAVPVDALGPLVRQLEALVARDDLPLVLPVRVRTVAADRSAWLSPMWDRESLVVSVRTVRGMPYTALFGVVQQLCRGFGGRPHWGLMHTLGVEELSELYPRWEDFVEVRRRFDPRGVLESPYLRRVLGPIS